MAALLMMILQSKKLPNLLCVLYTYDLSKGFCSMLLSGLPVLTVRVDALKFFASSKS